MLDLNIFVQGEALF